MMDWQTLTTFIIFAVAAGILCRRVWGFVRSGRAGKCGSCAGCGGTAKADTGLPLVTLGTESKPRLNSGNGHRPC